jgi:photosystem II stability/assembly factor-like uncharacterized protein
MGIAARTLGTHDRSASRRRSTVASPVADLKRGAVPAASQRSFGVLLRLCLLCGGSAMSWPGALAHPPPLSPVRAPYLDGRRENSADWFVLQRTYPTGRMPPRDVYDRVLRAVAPSGIRPRLVLPGDAWVPIGPQPIAPAFAGRIVAVATHPTDPNTIYVGAERGGVWKTTDAGQTWSLVTSDLVFPSIWALAIDPVTPNVLYASTYNGLYPGRLLRTTDAGATWQDLAPVTDAGVPLSVVTFRLDPFRAGSPTHSTIYLTDEADNLYRSDDSGRTFRLVLAPPSGTTQTGGGGSGQELLRDVRLDPARSGWLSVVTASLQCSGPSCTASTNNTLLLYRSTDGGNHWNRTLLLGIGPLVFPTTRLAIAAKNPDVQMVAFLDDGQATARLLRTTDGGETWSEISTMPKPTYLAWPLSVGFAPGDSNTMYVGNLNVSKSSDGGHTWGTLGVPHVDETTITFDAGAHLIVGGDGGIFRADSSDVVWTALNQGLAITECYSVVTHPVTGLTFLIGTQDNGTAQFVSNVGWSELTGGDGGDVALDVSNAATARAYTETEWTSTNGTRAFDFYACPPASQCVDLTTGINKKDAAPFIPRFAVDLSHPATIYLTAERIYRTDSNAANWVAGSPTINTSANKRCWQDPVSGTRCAPAVFFTTVAVAPTSSQTVYAGALNGDVWVTTDQGVSWRSVASVTAGPLPVRAVSEIVVDPANSQTAYVAYSGFNSSGSGQGHVFRTSDGGTTWIDLSGNLPDIVVNALLIDPESTPRTLYAGTDMGVFRMLDDGSGNHWQPYSAGLPLTSVTRLAYSRASRTLAAATYGRGVWIISGRLTR